MSDQPAPTAVDDANAYTRDKVSVLLKLASWYVRLRRPNKVERLLGIASDLVERGGGMYDAELNRLLDDYADAFRRLKRPVEAGRLADLAQRVRDAFPDEFYPDGADKPWWLQDKFTSRAPSLPVEFHSSHADDPGELNAIYASAVALAVMFPMTLFVSGALGALNVYVLLLAIIVPIIAGVVVSRRHKRALLRKGAESWVRVTLDGVHYHDPKKTCDFRWADIRHVWTSWQSGPSEDVTYPSVVVVGPHDHFEMSARFFTEQEVRWVNGLCKLHSGQTTFEDWRERP
jgi:hypothetical protein